jgi:hypothetical protein
MEKRYSEFLSHHWGRDSVVGVVSTGRPEICGSIPAGSKTYLSAPSSPRRRLGPHSLLFSGYREFSPGCKAAGTSG